VLDEPTASLDFGNQGRVLREIRALGAAGHGVLFTTHDPNHAMRAADRACLLRRGAVISEGPAKDVLTLDNLSALYDAKIQRLTHAGGDQAFRRSSRTHPFLSSAINSLPYQAAALPQRRDWPLL
jgi:iron complex transport system ATP-binding protein